MNKLSTALLLGLFLALSSSNLALADNINFDFGNAHNVTARIIQMIGLLTILSLAPSILIMVTSFTRITIVLSFLRSALGLQQSPPNSVLISLALFLTFFIMSPTFETAYKNGIAPLMEERIEELEALDKIVEPFAQFMKRHVRTKDLELFLAMSRADPDKVSVENPPLQALVPAFMISELRRAFEIGFLIFIPFIIIDILVASLLMAMGMMMVPPVMVSLPFKIVFFVIVDGWYMICGSLVKSFTGT